MRYWVALLAIGIGTGANAQADPLAPLPDAPVAVRTAAALPPPVQSTTALTGFAGYKTRLAGLARSAGVREVTIQSVLPYLSLNSRVIQLDRAQPGGVSNPNAAPPFAPYRHRHDVTLKSLTCQPKSGFSRAAGGICQWLDR